MKDRFLGFMDLVTYKEVAAMLIRKKISPKTILLLGATKKITVYAANKSTKHITLFKWEWDQKEDGEHYKYCVDNKNELIPKGWMIPLTRYMHFDLMFKGVLNELDLYHGLDGYEPNDVSQDINRSENIIHGTHSTPFHPISEKDLFITNEDLSKLKEIIENPPSEKQTVQQRREVIFSKWVDENPDLDIPRIKKTDVWSELRKIDHALFSVEPKNFFREQKIITFKPGRK